MTRAPIVPGAQAAHRVEPREIALDHPAVAAQALLRLDAAPRDPRLNVAHATCAATLTVVVPLVGVHLGGTPPRSAGAPVPQGRNRVEELLDALAVVDVRRREPDGEGDAGGVDHKMALAARSAFIRRIRADDVAPLFAATVELSMAARLQSISSAQLSSCNNVRCSRFHTPRRVHVRNRRQQVDPLPHPSSSGMSCHGRAVRRTNRMPVSTWRFETRGRPPFFPGFRSRGSSGATFVHNSSLTRGFIPHRRVSPWF